MYHSIVNAALLMLLPGAVATASPQGVFSAAPPSLHLEGVFGDWHWHCSWPAHAK